jgi:acetyl esterase
MSLSHWKEETITIEGGQPLMAHVYGAASAKRAPRPLVLHLHGGAFVGGDLLQGSRVASLLAEAGAAVVSLAYPLAPEHPFPQAAEAAHAALSWAQSNRRKLAGGHASLFIAGEEAGGNLAAATALMARDRHGPALAGQILLSPMLDLCVATASWRQALVGRPDCPWAEGWRAYLPRAADATHPYARPGTPMRLGGLPATLLITAQDDPLHDEAVAYGQRLRAAGVQVDEAVLALATGWPGTFLQPASTTSDAAPWACVVREHLRRFLQARNVATT